MKEIRSGLSNLVVAGSIYDIVEAQLPPKLVELLDITIRADPYYLSTEVTFKTKAGLELVKVNLDYDFINKHSVRYASVKIPDHVVSYLCMVPI